MEYGNGILFVETGTVLGAGSTGASDTASVKGFCATETASITLDTGLSPREAGQSRLPELMQENGWVARPVSVSKSAEPPALVEGAWTFEPWRVTDTHAQIAPGHKTESVFVSGAFFDGVPLYELLAATTEQAEPASGTDAAEADTTNQAGTASGTGAEAGSAIREAARAVNTLNRCVEYALSHPEATNGTPLPHTGPLGTLIGRDGSILFLPQKVFLRSLQSRSHNEQSLFDGQWQNPLLTGNEAWRFTIAAYQYTVSSGSSPFPEKDAEKRSEDYLDHNFVPLEKTVELMASIDAAPNGSAPAGGAPDAGKPNSGAAIDTKTLFRVITHNLNLTVLAPKGAQKRGQGNGADGKKAKLRRTTPSIKSDDAALVSLKNEELPPAFARKLTPIAGDAEYTRFQKKLTQKRFVRKHSTALKVTAVAAAILAIVTGTTIRDRAKAPTTKGLTPVEVVEMFYSAIDTLDTTNLDAARYKKAGNGYSNLVATYYVTSIMRQSYEQAATLTPSKWLWLKDPLNANVFGVTQLNIAQTAVRDNGDTDFEADFYILTTGKDESGEPGVFVTRYADTLTVSFKKNRYLITELETVIEEDVFVDNAEFRARFTEALSKANGADQPQVVVKALGNEYPWFPRLEDVLAFE